MTIRRAKESDISKLIDLLEQVLLVHHKVRPDLFQEKGVKYTEAQLAELIADDNRPIFVYEDEEGEVLGQEIGCYNLTLNVWSANKSAVRFYERQGMTPQETRMEQMID